MRALLILLVAALCSPSLVLAKDKPGKETKTNQEKLEKAAAIYKEADNHYKVKEYEQALAGFKEAYLLTSEPVLLFNIAQCHRQLGQLEEARKSYEAFVRDAPDSELRGNAETRLQETISEINRLASKGIIQISSKQDPTAVFLDGQAKGSTPLSLSEIEPGDHTLVIKKDGYENYSLNVKVKPAETLALEVPELIELGLPKEVLYTIGSSAVVGSVGSAVGVLALIKAVTSKEISTQTDSFVAAERVKEAKTLALVSDVCLGAAALGLSVGLVLRHKAQGRSAPEKVGLQLNSKGLAVQVRY